MKDKQKDDEIFALNPSSCGAARLQHLLKIYLVAVVSFLSTNLWRSLCIPQQLQGSYPQKREDGDYSSCAVQLKAINGDVV